jgi:hypothetical protein
MLSDHPPALAPHTTPPFPSASMGGMVAQELALLLLPARRLVSLGLAVTCRGLRPLHGALTPLLTPQVCCSHVCVYMCVCVRAHVRERENECVLHHVRVHALLQLCTCFYIRGHGTWMRSERCCCCSIQDCC